MGPTPRKPLAASSSAERNWSSNISCYAPLYQRLTGKLFMIAIRPFQDAFRNVGRNALDLPVAAFRARRRLRRSSPCRAACSLTRSAPWPAGGCPRLRRRRADGAGGDRCWRRARHLFLVALLRLLDRSGSTPRRKREADPAEESEVSPPRPSRRAARRRFRPAISANRSAGRAERCPDRALAASKQVGASGRSKLPVPNRRLSRRRAESGFRAAGIRARRRGRPERNLHRTGNRACARAVDLLEPARVDGTPGARLACRQTPPFPRPRRRPAAAPAVFGSTRRPAAARSTAFQRLAARTLPNPTPNRLHSQRLGDRGAPNPPSARRSPVMAMSTRMWPAGSKA